MEGATPIKRARALIADDHVILIEAFRKLLKPAHDVVGWSASALIR